MSTQSSMSAMSGRDVIDQPHSFERRRGKSPAEMLLNIIHLKARRSERLARGGAIFRGGQGLGDERGLRSPLGGKTSVARAFGKSRIGANGWTRHDFHR